MRILLLGAGGQVGQALLRPLDALGELLLSTRDGRCLRDGRPTMPLDLSEPGAVEPALAALAPDLIVNAAAHTAVDRAEAEPELAALLNTSLPGVLGRWARERGARVVHYSTDYVFDGLARRPYREDDAVAPRSVYGRTKAAGEQALRDSGAAHLILRTAWVYAGRGSNFLRTVLRLAREREQLRIVDDQLGAPTPATVIAQATGRLLAAARRDAPVASGTLHLTCRGSTTWHGFARAILARAGERGLIARMPELVPIATADWPTPAARPAYSVLDLSRIEARLGTPLPDWERALDAVLDTEMGD